MSIIMILWIYVYVIFLWKIMKSLELQISALYMRKQFKRHIVLIDSSILSALFYR